jgi:PadR family transcriptional regulator AphA
MNIRTICLAILAHGEASGYDLKKNWEDGPFSYLGGASFGSIYPALARLEQDGLIKSREETQPG